MSMGVKLGSPCVFLQGLGKPTGHENVARLGQGWGTDGDS